MTSRRQHISSKKQSWGEVSGAVRHQSTPMAADQDGGPCPGSSLVHCGSSCMASANIEFEKKNYFIFAYISVYAVNMGVWRMPSEAIWNYRQARAA